MGEESPVFDPEALEEAEEAARATEPDQDLASRSDTASAHSDERWVMVASAATGDPGRSLEAAFEVLREAGIPVGFDPYRPGLASSPYGQGSRVIRVVVPESFEARARDALRGAHVWLPGEPAPESVNGSASAEQSARQVRDIHPWHRFVVALIIVALLLAVVFAGLATASLLMR